MGAGFGLVPLHRPIPVPVHVPPIPTRAGLRMPISFDGIFSVYSQHRSKSLQSIFDNEFNDRVARFSADTGGVICVVQAKGDSEGMALKCSKYRTY